MICSNKLTKFLKRCSKLQDSSNKSMCPSLFIYSNNQGQLEDLVEEAAIRFNNLKIMNSGTEPLHIQLLDKENFQQEFGRIYHTLQQKHLKYKNSYTGVLTVDLSDWIHSYNLENLEAMLAYFSDTQTNNRYYVFYANGNEQDVCEISKLLDRYFILEYIDDIKIDKTTLFQYALDYFTINDIIQTDEAKESLMAKLDDSLSFSEVKKLCMKIISKMTMNDVSTLNATILNKSIKDFNLNPNTKSVIGLIKEEKENVKE